MDNSSERDTLLHFKEKYKSLNPFDDVRLKPLSIITGLNGSGKSHLLEAIRDGAVTTQFGINEIQLHTFVSLMPNDAGMTNTHELFSSDRQVIEWVRMVEREYDKKYTAIAQSVNFKLPRDKWNILNVPDDQLASALGQPENDTLCKQLTSMILQFEQRMNVVHGGDSNSDWQNAINAIRLRTKRRFLGGLTMNELRQLPYGWHGTNIFQQSFAHMFFAYFEKERANRYKKLAIEDGKKVENYLSPEDFLRVNGKPPWIFVNDLLEQAKLPFRVSFPDNPEMTEFTPILIDHVTGEQYLFSSLSSGEKILMSFAICLYHSNDKRHIVAKPKLLLLDEIDASLHPLMCRQLIDVISNAIVADQGVNVIMTTHSPSTIAMCPEENIYLMKRGVGLSVASKNQAMATLTAGIPTLTINYSGRRQVFTEDKSDAYRYERIYIAHKHNLNSERSLNFVPIANSKVEVSGCAQVQSTVKNLCAAGNTSVFGILDWDSKNCSEGNVLVMSEKVHYSIENILLDPVLIAAAIFHETTDDDVKLGLAERISYATFINSENSTLQRASNYIQKTLLSTIEAQTSIKYAGGEFRNVDNRLLIIKGHELEKLIFEKFPMLRRYENESRLTKFMVDHILADAPALVPNCVIEAFNNLLSRDATT